jgi:16S rRNA (uracil1498-N3)-methyltransferase
VHRCFAPAFSPGDETVALSKDEGEYVVRVLRLGVGDTVSVFDGRGHECLARVTSVLRRDVRLQLATRVEPAAEPVVPITLAQAVLKGDKMDEVVRDAVMLGAAAIQPIVSARSETTVAALARGGRIDRWQRVALASVRQSRRAVVPVVHPAMTLDTFLAEPPGAFRVMMVEPSAAAAVEPLSEVCRQPGPDDASLLVGPEGGWTEAEWLAARASGVHLVTLGRRTLRADAVPVAAICLLQFLWGDL